MVFTASPVVDRPVFRRFAMVLGSTIIALSALTANAAFAQEAAQQGATQWAVQKDTQKLTFDGTQMGQVFTGTFGAFDADIAFDPQNLGASRVTVTVDMSSGTSGDTERDDTIKASEWFNVASFPTAQFNATSFAHDYADKYIAKGTLKIRDFEQAITLPFTFVATDVKTVADSQDNAKAAPKTARVEGNIILNRLDYGLGAQNWKDEDSVGHDVTVRFALDLIAQDTAVAAPEEAQQDPEIK